MNFQDLMKKMTELDQPIQEQGRVIKGTRYGGSRQRDDVDSDSDTSSTGSSELSAADRARNKAIDAKHEKDGKDWEARGYKRTVVKGKSQSGSKEQDVDESLSECGMMGDLSAPMSAPKQQDSVSMSVNMNGSGTGGIRDLLNVLKDIQSDSNDSMPDDNMDMGPDDDMDMGPDDDMDMGPDDDNDMLLKKNIDSMSKTIDDDFANSMVGDEGPKMGGLDMMTTSGDDLHREKDAYPKASGGDNAMKLKDGAVYKLPKGDIQVKLESLYREILSRDLTEGSGPKEKQHSKYVDRNSAESKSKVQAARDKTAKDQAAKPGKELLKKINARPQK